MKEFLESPSSFSLEELKLNNCGLGAGAVVSGDHIQMIDHRKLRVFQTVANSLKTLHANATTAGQKLKLKVIIAGKISVCFL